MSQERRSPRPVNKAWGSGTLRNSEPRKIRECRPSYHANIKEWSWRYSRRQLFAKAAIAASRVWAYPCVVSSPRLCQRPTDQAPHGRQLRHADTVIARAIGLDLVHHDGEIVRIDRSLVLVEDRQQAPAGETRSVCTASSIRWRSAAWSLKRSTQKSLASHKPPADYPILASNRRAA